MLFSKKYEYTGIDRNIAKVLNAYNYLEALHVILNKPIADEEGGAAAGVPSGSLTFSEFNLSSYLWQLVVNNLQTLPRDFTSAPEFALARAVFFPAGRDGDQRWYNTDRDNFAHLDHILDGFDATRTNGLKGYLLGEVGRLLPVIERYLIRKLDVSSDYLTPEFEPDITDIPSLEGSQLFQIGRAIAGKMKTESTNMTHFEASCVWHAKLLYHVLATNKVKAFGLEQLSTINCLVEVIGNNLKEVAFYASEAKYARLRDSLSGIFIEQRNSLAHALELKLVDPKILSSIRAKMGLDLDAVPLEAGTLAFAKSLAGGLLLPAATEASEVAITEASVSVKAGSDDEFSAAVGSKASSKKSKAAKGSKSKTKGKGTDKVGTKVELSDKEFSSLMEQLESITVERDDFSNRTVAKKLSGEFVSIIIPFYNDRKKDLDSNTEKKLLEIIKHPAFDPHKNVLVYRLDDSTTIGQKLISLSKAESKESLKDYDLDSRKIGLLTESESPFTTVVSMANTVLIKAMLETGGVNIDSVQHRGDDFYSLTKEPMFAIELISNFPNFFVNLATKKASICIIFETENKEHKIVKIPKFIDQTFLEYTILKGYDDIVCALLKVINLSDFDIQNFRKVNKEYTKWGSASLNKFNYELLKVFESLPPESKDYTKIKEAAIISIFISANLPKAAKILVNKYVDEDFRSIECKGKSLVDLIKNGIIEDRDFNSEELRLSSRENSLLKAFESMIAAIQPDETFDKVDVTSETLEGGYEPTVEVDNPFGLAGCVLQ